MLCTSVAKRFSHIVEGQCAQPCPCLCLGQAQAACSTAAPQHGTQAAHMHAYSSNLILSTCRMSRDLVFPSELAGVHRVCVACFQCSECLGLSHFSLCLQVHVVLSQPLLTLLSLGFATIFTQQSH